MHHHCLEPNWRCAKFRWIGIRISYLDEEQSILDELSSSIESKLKDWAHPDVTANVLWTQDAEKSVRVDEPWAYIRIGERGFESELARFGHGMQRSFMLTMLQELASSDEKDAPTLCLAIEEPELYQHPPQARYLSEVLHDLAQDNSQITVCTHSPLFIPGDDFETVRVVRDVDTPSYTSVSQLSYKELASQLHNSGQKPLKEEGMLAKLYPSLNPGLNEMFFCKVLVLVEGIEDVAYISSYMSLEGLMPQFRKYGAHIVPVGGKSEIIKPLAIAKQLDIPVFVVIDADTNTTKPEHVNEHKKDNKSILTLMEYSSENDWPDSHIWKPDFVMWKENLTELIASEMGNNWQSHLNDSYQKYGQPGGIKKNPLAISSAIEIAWNKGDKSESLGKLVSSIISFAKEKS